jgi:4-carboxymuconolactone decarboxylase
MAADRSPILASLLALAAVVSLTVAGTTAQSAIDPPGARRPEPPSRPRVAPLPEAQWTDTQRQLAAKYALDGHADNALRTLLNVPEIVAGLLPYTNYLSEESTLSPRHRELLILRVAWLCGNDPLWATHAARARRAGLTTAEIRNVAYGPERAGWDPFDATLLRLTDQLFRNSSVAEQTWQTLAATFDMFHLIDAVETVGHFVMLSMIYNSLGVEPDTGLADRLPRDVPYRVVVPAREPALTSARFTPIEGRGISVNRTMARHPKLYERWQPRQTLVVRVSKLPAKQRELLTLRSGWNCQSEYEWAKHVGTVGRAREHGLDPVQIAEGASSPAWDALEKSLIRAADELYRDTVVSDATWRVLAPQLGTELTMTAVVTVSDFRAISLSLNAYGVQLEEGDEHFPKLPSR